MSKLSGAKCAKKRKRLEAKSSDDSSTLVMDTSICTGGLLSVKRRANKKEKLYGLLTLVGNGIYVFAMLKGYKPSEFRNSFFKAMVDKKSDGTCVINSPFAYVATTRMGCVKKTEAQCHALVELINEKLVASGQPKLFGDCVKKANEMLAFCRKYAGKITLIVELCDVYACDKAPTSAAVIAEIEKHPMLAFPTLKSHFEEFHQRSKEKYAALNGGKTVKEVFMIPAKGYSKAYHFGLYLPVPEGCADAAICGRQCVMPLQRYADSCTSKGQPLFSGNIKELVYAAYACYIEKTERCRRWRGEERRRKKRKRAAKKKAEEASKKAQQ